MRTGKTPLAVGLLIALWVPLSAQDTKQAFLDGIKKEIESNQPEAFFARFLDVGFFEARLREVVRAGIDEKMGKKVADVEIGPITELPPDRQKEAEEKFSQAGVPMPIYLVRISFSEGEGTSSMRFPVSEVDGKLFIVW